jgi:hypothetical protein
VGSGGGSSFSFCFPEDPFPRVPVDAFFLRDAEETLFAADEAVEAPDVDLDIVDGALDRTGLLDGRREGTGVFETVLVPLFPVVLFVLTVLAVLVVRVRDISGAVWNAVDWEDIELVGRELLNFEAAVVALLTGLEDPAVLDLEGPGPDADLVALGVRETAGDFRPPLRVRTLETDLTLPAALLGLSFSASAPFWLRTLAPPILCLEDIALEVEPNLLLMLGLTEGAFLLGIGELGVLLTSIPSGSSSSSSRTEPVSLSSIMLS